MLTTPSTERERKSPAGARLAIQGHGTDSHEEQRRTESSQKKNRCLEPDGVQIISAAKLTHESESVLDPETLLFSLNQEICAPLIYVHGIDRA
jgi:hypothetical protein